MRPNERCFPWAYAQGYMLSPLSGWKTAFKMQERACQTFFLRWEPETIACCFRSHFPVQIFLSKLFCSLLGVPSRYQPKHTHDPLSPFFTRILDDAADQYVLLRL